MNATLKILYRARRKRARSQRRRRTRRYRLRSTGGRRRRRRRVRGHRSRRNRTRRRYSWTPLYAAAHYGSFILDKLFKSYYIIFYIMGMPGRTW